MLRHSTTINIRGASYRLKNDRDRPDLVLWSLWSRNRNEEVEGAYSHETALSLYELSDLNPTKLHMTVPSDFRRNSEIRGILVRGLITRQQIRNAQMSAYARKTIAQALRRAA